MRIMRPNYDKSRRCPVWSGPAMRWGYDHLRDVCPSGSVRWEEKQLQYWTPAARCNTCGTWVLSPMVSKLSIPFQWGQFTFRFGMFLDDRKYDKKLRKEQALRHHALDETAARLLGAPIKAMAKGVRWEPEHKLSIYYTPKRDGRMLLLDDDHNGLISTPPMSHEDHLAAWLAGERTVTVGGKS